jgi:lipid-A-disaccharide synthase-like uncharacterized protein
MRRSAVTNRYVTSERQTERRFLMIPELKQGEKWKFVGTLNHPFFKHGPFLQWQNRASNKTVMINRQLFYMMMTGTMEMEK